MIHVSPVSRMLALIEEECALEALCPEPYTPEVKERLIILKHRIINVAQSVRLSSPLVSAITEAQIAIDTRRTQLASLQGQQA